MKGFDQRVDHAGDLHVYPVGDLKSHVYTRSCWCVPTIERDPDWQGKAVVSHNSMDGRELIEKHGVQ